MLHGISPMNKKLFFEHIKNFRLNDLFRELGWDNFDHKKLVIVDNIQFAISGLAEKKSFSILECICSHNKPPDHALRKKIMQNLVKDFHYHLLIFTNQEKTWQYWQLPLREDGKFKQLVLSPWHKGQVPEGLYQRFRNIVFTLDEEDNITLLDVVERVNISSANSEKVTKKFYAEFIKEHNAFLDFIKGIDDALPNKDNSNKQWYASLMLNRLMFCYFIQKKGYLNGEANYLQNKLAECQKLKGKNNFYGFYRSFLLELFHNELGKAGEKRAGGEKHHPDKIRQRRADPGIERAVQHGDDRYRQKAEANAHNRRLDGKEAGQDDLHGDEHGDLG